MRNSQKHVRGLIRHPRYLLRRFPFSVVYRIDPTPSPKRSADYRCGACTSAAGEYWKSALL